LTVVVTPAAVQVLEYVGPLDESPHPPGAPTLYEMVMLDASLDAPTKDNANTPTPIASSFFEAPVSVDLIFEG
jgi:hypothetical protein